LVNPKQSTGRPAAKMLWAVCFFMSVAVADREANLPLQIKKGPAIDADPQLLPFIDSHHRLGMVLSIA
jgi:hypothetical protein